jgi:hypothetical protein
MLVAIQGALRPVRSCAIAAAAASATTPLPDAIAFVVLKRCAASWGPSEKKSPDRPGGEDGECGEEERATDDGRHARALDGQAERGAVAHRLRHEIRTDKFERDQREQHEVRKAAGLPTDLDKR